MSGFYILTTSNARVRDALYADVDKFIKSGQYELLMEAKESGSVMRMYTVGDKKTVTSFVMLAREADEVSFISFDGQIDRAQMEDLMAQMAKE